MNYIYTSIISYLLGTINVAYFYSKTKGFDIRDTGSHNAGASNMKVNFGWAAGIITCLCDFLKTFIAIRLCSYLFPNDEIIPYLAGAMTIVGHIFPFYMGFRGGKGFACYIGMLLSTDWRFALPVMVLTAVITYVTNYIVIGTLTVITITPIYYICTKGNIYVFLILLAVAALIAFKHRVNIGRIIRGEEIGLREKKKKEEKEEV